MAIILSSVFLAMLVAYKNKLVWAYMTTPASVDCDGLVQDHGTGIYQSAYYQHIALDQFTDDYQALQNPNRIVSHITELVCFCRHQSKERVSP